MEPPPSVSSARVAYSANSLTAHGTVTINWMDVDFYIAANADRVKIWVPQANMRLDLANAVAVLMPGPRLVEIGMTLDEIKKVARPEIRDKYGADTVIWKWFDDCDFNPFVVFATLQHYSALVIKHLPRPKPFNYLFRWEILNPKLLDHFNFDISFWAWSQVAPEKQALLIKRLYKDLPVKVRQLTINGQVMDKHRPAYPRSVNNI